MNHNDTENNNIAPDLIVAERFLAILDESDNRFTFEVIEEPKPKERKPKIQRYHGTLKQHQDTLINANLNGFGVFVAVNVTNGQGRQKANIVRVRAFFVDLDGSPLAPLHEAQLDPHIIVESSPSRYHAYWIVEGVPLEDFEPAQKQLAQQFSGDTSVCDLPRLMRIPGFLHRKGTLYRSRILETSGALPYQYKEFQKAFGLNAKSYSDTFKHQSKGVDKTEDTPVLIELRKRNLLRQLEDPEEGRWGIRCPWAHEHSNGDEAHYFSKPSKGYPSEGFKCFHKHCQHRDIRALRFFLGLTPTEGVEALPLYREVPPPLPYPVNALGPILSEAANELHITVRAPMAIIAQSLLGAASLIVQGHANVEIDGRIIALSLYLITVAESGERKSAIDDIALWAILNWQSQLNDSYKEEFQVYKMKLEKWQNAKKQKGSTSDNAASSENLQEPEPPIMPLIIIEEPTYEGLVKYLEQGQPSVGLFSDEGGRFLGGSAMNRDNLLKTLAGLSSLWDAKPNKPITRIRSGDKSLALYGRRVALHLMTQESVYSQLNQQSICDSQGFLPRCLISFPESTAGSRSYVHANCCLMPGVQRFAEQCNKLLDNQFPVAPPPAPKNQLHPPSISLSEEAKSCWVGFHDALESQLGANGRYHSIRRFGSKGGEHVLRIAGVLAVFENSTTREINVDHVQRAITIVEYYLAERLRLENFCSIDPHLLTAQKVLDWAQAKGNSGVLLRELYQYGPTEVRSKDKALMTLRILEEHGRAFPIPAHELREKAKGKAWRLIWLPES